MRWGKEGGGVKPRPKNVNERTIRLLRDKQLKRETWLSRSQIDKRLAGVSNRDFLMLHRRYAANPGGSISGWCIARDSRSTTTFAHGGGEIRRCIWIISRDGSATEGKQKCRTGQWCSNHERRMSRRWTEWVKRRVNWTAASLLSNYATFPMRFQR